MKKFSIIVPVYNTYDYLDKCLNSLVKQKNVKNDYEIIIVNDGTPDNSDEIILKYKEKYPKMINYIKKENGGLSSARNMGEENASGEYLIFVDSDDYLDFNLLSKLENHIKENNTPDLIRIDSRDVKTSGEVIMEVTLDKSNNEIELIKNIMKKNALEVPWAYVYNTKFYKDNNFKYLPYIHEDYGLTPIIIYKAKNITHLEFIGYNYVKRAGSIMAETKYEKLKKRVDDFFIQYCNHMEVIKKDSKKGKILRSYSLEAMINKLSSLHKEDLEKEIKVLKEKMNVSDIYCYNINKLIKRIIITINIKLYVKMYSKYKKV